MAAGDTKERIEKNSPRCSANKPVEFGGAFSVDAKTSQQRDYTRIDLSFYDERGHIGVKIFDPGKSPRDKEKMSNTLTWLFEAFGLDFKDIPPCRGGWHEFVDEVVSHLKPKKDERLYLKLTLNEGGWFTPGEKKCFSKEPDMEYTDGDVHFLADVDVKSPGTAILDEDIPSNPQPAKKPVTKTAPKPQGTNWLEGGMEDPLRVRKAPDASEVWFDVPAKPKEKEPPREKDWLDELDENRAKFQAEKSNNRQQTPNTAKDTVSDAVSDAAPKPEKPEWVEIEVAKTKAKRAPRKKKESTAIDPLADMSPTGFADIDDEALPY